MKLKKIYNNKLTDTLLSLFGYIYIKLVFNTTNWQIIFKNRKEKYSSSKPIIYAFWHGRLMMMPCFTNDNRKINVVISSHKDGKIIANIMKYFKFDIINTRKNNIIALKQIFSKLNSNQNIAITPDSAGRRGPRMKVNGNIINIAKKSNALIIPTSFSVKKGYIFNSWDRFLLPFPFGKGVFIYGNPINVEECDNYENYYKILLEQELNNITIEADAILNQ